MNALAAVLFALAGVAALADWTVVARELGRIRYLTKPAVLVLLIGAAVAIEPAAEADGAVRAWFVVALVLSLIGDVFLMLPGAEPGSDGPDLFVAGLASFLLGHVAYIVGLWQLDASMVGMVAAAAVLVVLLPFIGRRILASVRTSDESALEGPVFAYIAVISAMVFSAGRSGSAVALVGASTFAASDSAIAWSRFVRDFAAAPVFIIVTYHLAQAGLVASLL